MTWVRDYDPLRSGQEVTVTIGNVTAEAVFISNIGNARYVVRLAGTGETITVPGWVVRPKP